MPTDSSSQPSSRNPVKKCRLHLFEDNNKIREPGPEVRIFFFRTDFATVELLLYTGSTSISTSNRTYYLCGTSTVPRITQALGGVN